MSDTREKLTELLGYYLPPIDRSRCMPYVNGKCNGLCAECTAEQLISNGVTVQEWIPVSEPPKEWKHKNGRAINFLVYTPEYGIDIGNYLKPANAWLCMGIPCNATHWMPLPEPPTDSDVIDIEQIEVEL